MDVQNAPGRGRTPTVEIEVGAAYEFLMTLHVMTSITRLARNGSMLCVQKLPLNC